MSQRKYLAWDIEISRVLPEGETDWQAHMPLGISCMATYMQDESGPAVWFGLDEGTAPQAMSVAELRRFIAFLQAAVKDGYTIVTWNGLSFDWHQLAFESGLHEACCELAANHCDPMFQIFCHRGYPVGLDAIAKGLGLPGKMEGVSGEKAPILWQQGEYDTVLKYVAQDVISTMEVVLEIAKRGHLAWIAKSGRLNTLPVPKLLTVRECLELPEPDTSWMTSPIPRSRFIDWMHKETTP